MHDHDLSLLSKSSEVSHGGFWRFRRFWWVDHGLELVVADPTISVLIIVMSMLMVVVVLVFQQQV